MRDDTVVDAELKILSTERLVLFSDAVVAIAITLLALDLHVPTSQTDPGFWREMGHEIDGYLGFLISFMVIGAHWLIHHRVFGYVTRLSRALVRWNLLWLLTIVLTPFATKVIVAAGALPARLTVYALVQAGATAFFLLSVHEIDRSGLARDDTPRSIFSRTYLRLSLAAGAFLVSVPVAFLVGRWAYLCWVAIPFLARARDVLAERWRRIGPHRHP